MLLDRADDKLSLETQLIHIAAVQKKKEKHESDARRIFSYHWHPCVVVRRWRGKAVLPLEDKLLHYATPG